MSELRPTTRIAQEWNPVNYYFLSKPQLCYCVFIHVLTKEALIFWIMIMDGIFIFIPNCLSSIYFY